MRSRRARLLVGGALLSVALVLVLRSVALRVLPALLTPDGIEVTFEGLDLTLSGEIVTTGIRARWQGGSLGADTLRTRLSLRQPHIRALRVVGPAVVLDSDGATGRGLTPLPEVSLGDLHVEGGTVEGDLRPSDGGEPVSWRIEGLKLSGAALRSGSDPTGSVDSVAFVATSSSLPRPVSVRASAELGPEGPDIDVRLASERSAARFRGRGLWNGDLSTFVRSFEGDLELSPLHLADLTPFLDVPLPDGTAQGSLLVEGPDERASGELTLDLGDMAVGSVRGRVEIGSGRAFRAALTAALRSERPDRLGLPVEGPVEADLELELAGPQWSTASGRLSGQAVSERAGAEATLDVRASSGRLDADVQLVVDGRQIGLRGTSSLDVLRRWTITARAPQAGIEGTGVVELMDHPRARARIASTGPYLDSAHVSFGMERPGHMGAVAFNGPGTARLTAHLEHDTLVVSELQTSNWAPGPAVPGAWNARVTGWLSGSPTTANGRLAIRVDSILGGALDGVHALGEVSLVAGVAHVRSDVVRGADSLRAEGTTERTGDTWSAALTDARLRWQAGQVAHTLTWRGLLELSPDAFRGGGTIELAPVGPSETGWRGQSRVEAASGGLLAEGHAEGPWGPLAVRATAAGPLSRPGALGLDVEADSLDLALGGGYPLALHGVSLNVETPRWTHPREQAELVLAANGVGGALVFDSVRARGRTTDDGALRLRARLHAPGLSAEGRVRATPTPDGTVLDSVDVMVEAAEAGALTAATTGLLDGTGTAELRVRRQGGRLDLDGNLDLEGAAGRGWRSDRLTMRADGAWSNAGIRGDFTAHAEHAAAFDGPPVDLEARVQADEDSVVIAALLGPDVRMHVAGANVEQGISIRRGSLVVVRDTLVLERPAVLDLRDQARGLSELSFVGAGASAARLAVSVSAPRAEPWNVQAALSELPAPELVLWLPGVPVRDGRMSGQGRLRGGGGAPAQGEGSMRLVTPLRSGAQVAVEATAGFDADWARVTVEALLQGRTAVADGAFPRRQGVGDPRLEIRADSFPLDPLSDRGEGGSLQGGTVNGALARVGPDGSAELQGSLRIHADRWDVPGAELRLTDFDATLTGSGPSIRVEATAQEGGGSGSLEGTVGVLGVPTPTIDARIRTDRFPLAWSPTLVIRTIGDLDVSGTVARPRLRGDLRVESSEILLGTGGAEPIELSDGDRALLRERFGWRERTGEPGSWLPLDALDADLGLELGGDVWVRRWADPELALALSGSLQMRKEPGQGFQYVGTLTPIHTASGFRQFGRRFSVSSGSIELLGPLSRMEFEVVGRHEVPSRSHPGSPEAVITMTVRGSADDMSVVLASEPSLDQTDIVSYLLLGQPSDQISSSGGTSAAEAGAGIALGRLSGLLGETASQTIGLDVVDLEPRGLGGVTLVVGRYLTPRLYVAVRQPVAWQPGTEATGFERLPSLEAELATARWLLLNLQGDAQGFGLRLRSRWGY